MENIWQELRFSNEKSGGNSQVSLPSISQRFKHEQNKLRSPSLLHWHHYLVLHIRNGLRPHLVSARGWYWAAREKSNKVWQRLLCCKKSVTVVRCSLTHYDSVVVWHTVAVCQCLWWKKVSWDLGQAMDIGRTCYCFRFLYYIAPLRERQTRP